MGFNSTIIVRNDALHDIEKDPEFGKNVAAAIMGLHSIQGNKDIRAGMFINAASAVETHHADGMMIIAVGGNTARVLGYGGHDKEEDLDLIKNLARRLGYDLRRRKKP